MNSALLNVNKFLDEGSGVNRIALFLAFIVGILLIVSAVLKGMDMMLFVRQIRDYGIISRPIFLLLTAWGIVSLELIFGLGLILRYRPRVILPGTALLVLLFIAATGWAWITGATEDCGCFGGWLKRTPGEALLEDLVLLAMIFFSWLLWGRFQHSGGRIKTRVFFIIFLVGLIFPGISGLSTFRSLFSQSNTGKINPELLQAKGLNDINLRKGSYLVILMDTNCPLCVESLDDINDLTKEKMLPPVVGLCMNNENERGKFIEEFAPLFPLGIIREEAFRQLLGEGDTPRTILLREGYIKHIWDRNIPGKAEILNFL